MKDNEGLIIETGEIDKKVSDLIRGLLPGRNAIVNIQSKVEGNNLYIICHTEVRLRNKDNTEEFYV